MGLLDASKYNYAFKKLLGRLHTSNSKNFYEEKPGIISNVMQGNVWTGEIPAVAPSNDTVAIKVYSGSGMLRLTEDTSVASRQAFLAKATFGDLNSAQLTNFIQPNMGQTYSVRLFIGGTSAANEIPSSHSSNWIFDYDNGVLAFESTPPAGNVYIQVCRYIGPTLADLSAGFDGLTTQLADAVYKGIAGNTTPATSYTITHNLNSEYVKIVTYVPGELAGEWIPESFQVILKDNNTIQLNLSEAKKVKYIIESVV
jgi:hypothetical protein